jgi:DNA-directed RNA polymerase subunit RPC12/RpoP
MTLGKSLLIGLIVVAGIVAAVFAVRGCRHTPESALRQYVGNQVCLACGHEWHMDTKVMMEERLKDPTGHRFTQCPKCGAWRGVAVGRCAKCGKRIPKVAMRENPEAVHGQ